MKLNCIWINWKLWEVGGECSKEKNEKSKRKRERMSRTELIPNCDMERHLERKIRVPTQMS